MENYSVQFKGNASEYFKIWIVNTFLTIITFGLYSPWAKVRNRKYLYGNTYLHGSSFDYTADPIKILKGRLIIGAFVILYNFGPYIHISVALIASIIFMALLPWIIVKGAIFNLTNTTYRNIRFGFNRVYKESYKTYIKAGLLTVFTFGLGFAWALCMHKKFIINNAKFGNKNFNFKGEGMDFLGVQLRGIGIYILFIIAGIAVMFLGKGLGIPVRIGAFALVAFTYIGIACSSGYIAGSFTNLVGNGSGIEDMKFQAKLDPIDFMFIYLTNLIAIICSLGFATPWAIIRARKYKCEKLSLLANNDEAFSSFTQSAEQSDGSAQDAAIDFLDIDLGF